MGVTNVVYVTISCSRHGEIGEGCPHTITFLSTQQREVFAAPENAWLRSVRIVQRGLAIEGQQPETFLYCSDVCEAFGIKTGLHNTPAPRKMIDVSGASAAQIAQAAAVAKATEEATRQLKSGPGPQLVK